MESIKSLLGFLAKLGGVAGFLLMILNLLGL